MPDRLRQSTRLPLRLLILTATFLPSAGASATAADHPVVAGFERFYAGGQPDAVRGGRLLLGELNCVSCHRPEDPQAAALDRKQAPVLDGVGGRVRRSYLRKFLADPQAVKPGTTMPNLFAGVPAEEKRQKVEELTHFLASTGSLKQERPDGKLARTGRELYHRVGCVACHGTRDAAANADKILPTSVPLGDLKAKYSIASLAAFLENPHQVRPSGRMPQILNRDEARQVANYLLQGIPYKAAAPNMAYAYYEGEWQNLPDFDKLKPRATGKASGFDLGVARRSGNFALRFEGYLRIDQAGEYRFHLTSDDGSKLFIDGKLAVSNDGVHPPSTVSGTARLTKGTHQIVAGVFNAGGGVELNVDIEGPGLARQPAAPRITLTPDGEAAKPKTTLKDEDDFPLDPVLVQKGQAAFASLGCASCHQLRIDGKVIESKLPGPALAKLKPEAGCLAKAPARGVPHYPLSTAQRSALAAAIKAPAAPGSDPKQVIARSLTTFNCYACHQRDKVGGVEDALNSFFTTTQPEMGDEGRVPPPLTGVGAKIATAWLNHILADGAKDRPYMHTRMPKFGAPNVGHLTRAFESVDHVEPAAKPTFKETTPRVKAAGRHLVGEKGMSCIKCHIFAGHKAEGVQGIDMTLMARRLKRDWFHRYLREPQRLRPGTRMPDAWPNGESVLPQVLGGDTDRQIEAIWVYLSDGGRALLPLGLNRRSIPLVPGKDAIVYRNFVEGAGPRAIAVGYPEKAHLAFDANDLRLALLWQGAFIDAARHWTDRGSGFEAPMGDNILHLPAGVSFAVLGKEDEAWPKKSARELGYKFRGYSLTPDERPTFRYSLPGVGVEDFPNAVAGNPAASIRRTISLTAKEPVRNLWFRAAVGDKIEVAGKGWYRIDGEWKVRVESGTTPKVRQSGGKKELLVPVEFHDGRAKIVQEFQW